MLNIRGLNIGNIIGNDISFLRLLHFLFFFIAALLGGIGCGLLLGGVFGNIGLYIIAGLIGIAIMIVILIFKQDELAITIVVAARLYVDSYLGLSFVALAMMILLLAFYCFSRKNLFLGEMHNILWLWFFLLIIAIIPAMQGIRLLDSVRYYCDVILSAFIMFCLGIVIGGDFSRIRRLLLFLSIFASIIAIITVIQATTGKLWFGTTRYETDLASIGGFYGLDGAPSVERIGAFFVNPNPSGGFLAMMLLIPLGLFWGSSTWLGKVLYLSEISLLLLALMVSFSTEAWLSLCGGIAVFLIFIGRPGYRLILLCMLAGIALIMVTVFPSQIAHQLLHAQDPSELSLRSGTWQTGIQVIRAFPLFGLGLAYYVYLLRAEPYRVSAQYIPLSHPHNAFLELAALGGLPVAFLFIALLLLAFWFVLRNWFRSKVRIRPLIASGMAITTALTIYSLSDAGWTLAPLLAVGWLILGAFASPIRSMS